MIVISSSGYDTTPWQAGLVGIISGFAFVITMWFIRWNKVDDVLSVGATFMIPGLIGGLLPGFITDANGCFWQGKSGNTLSTQVIGVVVVAGWAITWAAIIFGSLGLINKLTLSKELQEEGLDVAKLGQTGYDLESTQGKPE